MRDRVSAAEDVAEIRAELAELAAFYGLPRDRGEAWLDTLPMEAYVEVVLSARSFDVVVGGLGQEAALAATARVNGVAPGVVAAFEACTRRFPGKMLYGKTGPDQGSGAGSLYLVLLEPWRDVLSFLTSVPELAGGVDGLRAEVREGAVCFLLGFAEDPASGALTAKTYHLFDRSRSEAKSKPFLISYRVTGEGVRPQTKRYTAKASWDDLRVDARWGAVADLGQRLFGERYALLQGESSEGETKAYVFRRDAREGERYSPKSYNYYTEEGVRLLKLDDGLGAIQSFQNAIDYAPDDADAWNKLGFVYIIKGKPAKGIRYVLKAKALDPTITNLLVTRHEEPDLAAKLTAASRTVEETGSAASYNARGILWFHAGNVPRAVEDLEVAVAREPLNATFQNNLGGAYLKAGELVKALRACNVARSLSPTANPSNLDVARTGLRLLKQCEQAPSPQAFVDLGMLLCKLDLFERAKVAFEQAEAGGAVEA